MSKEQTNKNNKPAKNSKSNKQEAMIALADIRERYPDIHITEIEQFAPVYYPVAIVEMLLEEQTFEDFETVHLAVLRLVALGISDYKIIAQTLGLSASYVFKVLHLLNGYGHIDGNGLTQLGRESLNQQKKIITTDTLQKFQVDALNGKLLKTQESVAGNMLNSKDETITMIGHLNYLEGMDAQALSAQLTGDCDNYLNQKSGVLHTNVRRIKSARCTEIKYAKCYLMKLASYSQPIIFAKRYNRMSQDLKQRFPWQPFSVSNAYMIRMYGLEPQTPINTSLADEYVMQLYKMLTEYCAGPKVNLQEEVRNAVARNTPLQPEHILIPAIHPGRKTVISIREEALTKYSRELVDILLANHREGMYLLTTQWLYGHLIALKTEGKKLDILAGLLYDKVSEHGRQEVTRVLWERFRDRENIPALADEMFACLQEIKSR